MREQREALREMLTRNHLSQTWLIDRLERMGVITDKTELSGAMRGARKGPKVETLIRMGMEIINDYEIKMNA